MKKNKVKVKAILGKWGWNILAVETLELVSGFQSNTYYGIRLLRWKIFVGFKYNGNYYEEDTQESKGD